MSTENRASYEPHRQPAEKQRARKPAPLRRLAKVEKEIIHNPFLVALRRFSRDVDVGTRPPFRRIPEYRASE